MFRKYTDWKLVKQLLPASLIGALIGSIFLVGIDVAGFSYNPFIFAVLHIQKTIFDVCQQTKRRKKPTKYGASFIGLLSGALQGTGVSGCRPRNSYLYGRRATNPTYSRNNSMDWNVEFCICERGTSYPETSHLLWHGQCHDISFIVAATYLGRHYSLKFQKGHRIISCWRLCSLLWLV